MSSYSQDFIDAKLAAIRACQTRPAQKMVDKAKEKEELKQQRQKAAREAKAAKRKASSRPSPKEKEVNTVAKKDFKSSGSRDKVFKIKPFDPGNKILFRVDHKTQVYINPDDDRKAIKAKYNKKYIIKDDYRDRAPNQF